MFFNNILLSSPRPWGCFCRCCINSGKGLVFPTTVLLVPAFVLVLIPPLLASGLAGLSGLWPNP